MKFRRSCWSSPAGFSVWWWGVGPTASFLDSFTFWGFYISPKSWNQALRREMAKSPDKNFLNTFQVGGKNGEGQNY
ncbi:MAG: hypothetical protein EB078_04210 [Proteobacteria bacterium]|nr:hypothetical protein [Pseudomonadota bacterium]NDC24048.1 hypothetical protein [Pseudomonadota bacterium]NDD04088.1 hypothetical protein [Pseudomonadota bacterium]NDG26636.1 hypothetical protein [Pseudomonadota bacterium]